MSSPTLPCKRNYKVMDQNFVTRHFCEFYVYGSSFRKFCRDKGVECHRPQLTKLMQKIGLMQNKQSNRPWFIVEEAIQEYFSRRKIGQKSHLEKMIEDNSVLTDDEEMLVVKTCQLLSNMGLGIDRDTTLEVVNGILACRIEKKCFTPVTRGVITRLIKKHSNLLNLLKGNAIDPARVRQATEDVRNAMYTKLDNYIKILHAEGKVRWKCFEDIPPLNMSNMDEVATNTHDHRKKVVGDNAHLGRLFQLMHCGDGKMPFHITLCITSNPLGE